MRNKPLAILLVLAVVLVAIAVKTGKQPDTAAPGIIGKPLLPDLPVNDIERVVIVNQGSTTTVHKVKDQWTVAEKHDYPASFERIRNAVLKLADLKVADVRAATPNGRKDFGLVAPGPDQAETTQIELQGAGGKRIASLLLGQHHVRKGGQPSPYGGGEYPDGRYVAPEGATGVYMVKDPLTEFNAQPMGWMETELLNVDAMELTGMTLKDAKGNTLELEKSGSDDALNVMGLKADEEADASKVASLRNALAYLNLQDVADPALGDATMGFDAPVTVTASAKDGRRFTLQVGGKAAGDGRYVRCQVAFQEPPAPAATNAADGVTNAVPQPDTSAARAAAENLNRRLSGWTFVVPSYKAEALVMTRADVVKPKAKADVKAEPQTEATPPVPAGVPAPTPAPTLSAPPQPEPAAVSPAVQAETNAAPVPAAAPEMTSTNAAPTQPAQRKEQVP